MDSPQNHYFTYPPLNSNKSQIRLCQVTHRSTHEVRCNLKTFDLDEACPPYAALSYTWGEPLPTHAVNINGNNFYVRQNLWDYFTQGCLPDGGYIWIDQLSINQGDHHERNAQVSIMADIYSRAKVVYVWLGKAGRHTTAALAFLDNERPADQYKHKREFTQKLNADETEGLHELLHRPYWSRLWITQEHFFAKSKIWCCGSSWAKEWYGMFGAIFMNFLYNYQKLDQHTHDYLMNLCAKNHMVNEYSDKSKDVSEISNRGSFHLDDALRSFMGRGCHDVNDTVFGLQSMVRRSERIEIDYSRSPEEVFYATVWTIAVVSLKSSPDSLHVEVFRGLKVKMQIRDDFLDVVEPRLGLLGEEIASQRETDANSDQPGWPRLVDSSLIWNHERPKTEVEKRWDRVMMALPWGSRSEISGIETEKDTETE